MFAFLLFSKEILIHYIIVFCRHFHITQYQIRFSFSLLFTPISIGIQTARQGKLDRHRRVSKPPRKGETAGAAGD